MFGGLSVLCGFLAFFMVEKLVRHHNHVHGDVGAHGHHSHGLEHTASRTVAEVAADTPFEGAGGEKAAPKRPHTSPAPSRRQSSAEVEPITKSPAAAAPGAAEPDEATATSATKAVKESSATVAAHAASDGGAFAAAPKYVDNKAERVEAAHALSAMPLVADETDANGNSDSTNEPEATAASAAPQRRTWLPPGLQVSGYLNLAADAAHNFTDGLMLGAAFRTSWELGCSTTLAVLFHEVPHEVGDVAILMQAGFGKGRAIRAQLCTAVGALLGTLFALTTGRDEASTLLNFTAGGFVYVATVDVLPDLLKETGLRQTAYQLCAMSAGIGLMVAVLFFEMS